MKTKMQQLADLGQSIWLDYIQRSLIKSGELEHYVQTGLRGMTSNPAIFEKAIAETEDYNQTIHILASQGKTTQEIYENLVIEDIRSAADTLRSVFDQTEGKDGYISLEVNPHLAHDSQATIREAQRLFKTVGRPNLMIKVPATAEGMPAIRELIAEGINVNVTLIFSLEQYKHVTAAYLSGLEQRLAKAGNIDQIASVASFFVSRIDVKVDGLLNEIGTPNVLALRGKLGIAYAKNIYQSFKETFNGPRWDALSGKGARIQRVLYGSTSTKDPNYSDVMYVENLIGAQTVNTVPPKTLSAFLDHGKVAVTLDKNVALAYDQLYQAEKLGIHMDEVTRQLLDEGIEKFNKPYDHLLATIAKTKDNLIAVYDR